MKLQTLIVLAGGIVVITAAVLPRLRENFSSIDPIATGIERPLWGPLYKNDQVYNRHSEMRDLPLVLGELSDGEENIVIRDRIVPFVGKRRIIGDPKYEDNKI